MSHPYRTPFEPANRVEPLWRRLLCRVGSHALYVDVDRRPGGAHWALADVRCAHCSHATTVSRLPQKALEAAIDGLAERAAAGLCDKQIASEWFRAYLFALRMNLA